MWQSPFTGQPWWEGTGGGGGGTKLYVTVNIYLSATIISIKQKSTQGNTKFLRSYCMWHLAFTGQPPWTKSSTEAVSTHWFRKETLFSSSHHWGSINTSKGTLLSNSRHWGSINTHKGTLLSDFYHWGSINTRVPQGSTTYGSSRMVSQAP